VANSIAYEQNQARKIILNGQLRPCERPQIHQIQLRSKRANCIVKVPLPWVADRNEVE